MKKESRKTKKQEKINLLQDPSYKTKIEAHIRKSGKNRQKQTLV